MLFSRCVLMSRRQLTELLCWKEDRKKSTEKTKEKLSEAKKGDNNPTSKKVYQYTLDGPYIRSFSSGGEAGRYLNKKKDSKISACARCDHQRKSAHGFKWSYEKN